MIDGLLSGCLGFCRLRASRLTEAVQLCSTCYRLLLKGSWCWKVLLHVHPVEPPWPFADFVGFVLTAHALWQISYCSTMMQRQLLEFPAVSGLICLLCLDFLRYPMGCVWAKQTVTFDTVIFQKNANIWKRADMPHQSHLSIGQCASLLSALTSSLHFILSLCPSALLQLHHNETAPHKPAIIGRHPPLLAAVTCPV